MVALTLKCIGRFRKYFRSFLYKNKIVTDFFDNFIIFFIKVILKFYSNDALTNTLRNKNSSHSLNPNRNIKNKHPCRLNNQIHFYV